MPEVMGSSLAVFPRFYFAALQDNCTMLLLKYRSAFLIVCMKILHYPVFRDSSLKCLQAQNF